VAVAILVPFDFERASRDDVTFFVAVSVMIIMAHIAVGDPQITTGVFHASSEQRSVDAIVAVAVAVATDIILHD